MQAVMMLAADVGCIQQHLTCHGVTSGHRRSMTSGPQQHQLTFTCLSAWGGVCIVVDRSHGTYSPRHDVVRRAVLNLMKHITQRSHGVVCNLSAVVCGLSSVPVCVVGVWLVPSTSHKREENLVQLLFRPGAEL